jgi:ubiquinol-cytochrome c reductase iron-sulfur subunit
MPDAPPRLPSRAKPPLSNAEKGSAAAFVASMVASVGLFIVYWKGGQTQLEGLLLFVVLGGIGAGIVVWAKRFMPQGPFEEPRGQLASDQDDIDAFVADFEEGAEGMARRGFLAKLAAGALAGLGLAAIFPIRSLGPKPGNGLKETPYKGGGLRLVDEHGLPIRAEQLDVDSVITAFPEGHTDAANAPTLLIRLPPGVNQPKAGREGYAAGDLVAYSKLCSHLGCPVGLYQARERLLLCPCHQSTFDVPDGCEPIFGPASRPLPQLPIEETDDGFLIATGDFSDPVGPGFWNRGRD